MNKIPLHIDVDTGTDDAIALLCALLSQDKVDILSISAVAGNVPLELTAKNTLDIVDAVGEKIKIAKGAAQPLERELICATSHGQSGLGDVEIIASNMPFYSKDAIDTIYESACEANGKLVYMGVGPQTNLAQALNKYPDLKNKIARIYIMGGSLVGGNMTQASEFNAFVDPEALKIVVHSGIPMTMVGLDVTLKTVLPLWVVDEINQLSNPYAKIASQVMDYCLRLNKEMGYDEANIHDALAFCAIVFPEVIKTKKYYIDIETEGTLTRGMTVADFHSVYPDKEPNVDCAVEVDLNGFWNWMVQLFKKAEVK